MVRKMTINKTALPSTCHTRVAALWPDQHHDVPRYLRLHALVIAVRLRREMELAATSK